jgi:FKBP-type peptidyl-prolyl cis-trans isomerase 2
MRDTLFPVSSDLFPGQRVRLPSRPDWGIGQVQSVAGDRVTVNFEHAGKVTLRLSGIALDVVEDEHG